MGEGSTFEPTIYGHLTVSTILLRVYQLYP